MAILDGTTPTYLDDNDCLRFPPVPPPPGRGTEKKESRDHRRSRACQPLGRQFSTSSPALHRYDALTAKGRSEEHTSELQSLMRISYAVFCLKKKNTQIRN